MRCRALRDVLHREVESLDEAARLQLDDHLAGCARCRGDRERLRLLRQVATSLPVPPAGSREYGRAIARALLDGRASAPAPVRAWPRRAAIAAAAAAAAIAAVTLIARGGDPPGVARIDRASSTRSGMSGSALSGPALSGSGEAPAGTPAVAASPGTPAVAASPGTPAVAASPGTPAV
ncbi:MAG TPA: hypothetical protein VK607_15595, partial [Kofleriaceae bacterium]|nr:hypothetical protein [Kofleriaceae bacterium]